MNTRAAVTYPGFGNFADTQGNSLLITPALPVVNGSILYQQATSMAGTYLVSLPQKIHRLALLSRPQNFCFSTY